MSLGFMSLIIFLFFIFIETFLYVVCEYRGRTSKSLSFMCNYFFYFFFNF